MTLMAIISLALSLVLILSTTNSEAQLRVGFYANTCPNAESIVSGFVRNATKSQPRMPAMLLRLHFHDCFVEGCDGSILIENGPAPERGSPAHAGVDGFMVIENAKTQLESVCPGVVSCADIVALAARDAIVVSNGPSYQVETGRRDGFVSDQKLAAEMPDVNDSIQQLKFKFLNKGMSDKDLVLLSAAHTIGTTACFFMGTRLYNFVPGGGPDPTINPNFLPELERICPQNGDIGARLPMDRGSGQTFDNQILQNIRSGLAVLQSDAALYEDPGTRSVVDSYFGLLNPIFGPSFEEDFASSIVKMGRIDVKTGSQGTIRFTMSTPFSLLYALILTFTSRPTGDTATTPSVVTVLQIPIITNQTTSILPQPPTISLPAAHLQDDEEDKSLFRLASRVNPYPSSPRKISFLFLTTTPLPLAPLWELFFNQTNENLYNIYIHADPTFNYDPPFTGVFFKRTIPSKSTQRNSPTLIAAHRRLLAHALLDDPANYMFALISSSCIPIHSFSFTYKYLIGSRKSFIEILKYVPVDYGRWAARGNNSMLPEVKMENFRTGSQFSVMTRQHARTVVSDTRIWSKFDHPCVAEHMNMCYPEENYVPTLVSMVDPQGSVPATVTHVDWNRRQVSDHPHTYDAAEVGPELIFKLRSDKPRYGYDGTNDSDSFVRKRRVRFLFARKFTANTVKPLLEIANDVILED